jgi:hypothetical protein
MSTTPPNLGNVIPNDRARRIIYGVYAAVAFIVGGTAAYFLGIQHPVPEIVVGAQAVVAYAGIAIGGLALANVPTKDKPFSDGGGTFQ